MTFHSPSDSKMISFDELAKVKPSHPGKKVVHCHGVFDLFHFGHLLHLESAKKFGDLLVVTLTPDHFVNKGPGRPKYNSEQRAAMLASLEVVDFVAINRTPKAIEPILALKPDVYIKGPDYRNKQGDITGGILEEEEAVRSVGGQLQFTSDETESSTELLNRFFSQWDESQRAAIDRVRAAMSLDQMLATVEDFKKLRVLVVGEPIVDTYIFCQPEGLSSKSPTVSARFLNQEDYAGGSLAIANHLSALGCEVSLLLTHGGEPYFESLLKSSLDDRVRLVSHKTPGIPTPRKTRFITPFRAQRIFEIIDLRADQWSHASPGPFCESLRTLSSEHDITIIADFGHGIFEGQVLQTLSRVQSYVALNVQTNSGNFGFNRFTKHTRYDYLSIDERETRLGMHDRFQPAIELARQAVKESIQRPASITLGTQGSLYFETPEKEHLCPTFFKEIIDTTGAGDAYFAITSLLAYQKIAGPAVPFMGNCFAGLKTRIMGNKAAVSKVDFVRTLQSILK